MARETPILDQVNIVTANMRASLEFYRRLGVAMPPPAETQAGEPFHVNSDDQSGLHLDLDSPAFARIWNHGWAQCQDLAGRMVLTFRFGSRAAVDQSYDDLVGAGHRGLQPPWDAFWGARFAIVEDPDGIAVGLMSPIDPARKTWPPEGWSG